MSPSLIKLWTTPKTKYQIKEAAIRKDTAEKQKQFKQLTGISLEEFQQLVRK